MRVVRLQALGEKLRGSFWVIPIATVVLALAAGVGLPHVHVSRDSWIASTVFTGNAAGARAVLQAIAGSVITVTSLTFSLTVITLQLASSQFSPRVLRTFLRDLRNQSVLGIFLATFLYALTVLRQVDNTAGPGPDDVPKVAITFAYLLVIASVLALVWFLHHVVEVIRVDTLMARVDHETRDVIDRTYPPAEDRPAGKAVDTAAPELPQDARSICARTSGFLLAVDEGAMTTWARQEGLVVSVDVPVGAWVIRGACWARLAGGDAADDERRHDELLERSAVGDERTVQQDVGYGIRQLVDIAARALSPGVNDPTTAVHAIGRIGNLLAILAERDLGALLCRDDDGTIRCVLTRPTFADYLELGVGQIRRYGAAEPAVLVALLELLEAVASRPLPAVRRQAVETQLSAIAEDARREVAASHDRALMERRLSHVETTLAR